MAVRDCEFWVKPQMAALDTCEVLGGQACGTYDWSNMIDVGTIDTSGTGNPFIAIYEATIKAISEDGTVMMVSIYGDTSSTAFTVLVCAYVLNGTSGLFEFDRLIIEENAPVIGEFLSANRDCSVVVTAGPNIGGSGAVTSLDMFDYVKGTSSTYRTRISVDYRVLPVSPPNYYYTYLNKDLTTGYVCTNENGNAGFDNVAYAFDLANDTMTYNSNKTIRDIREVDGRGYQRIVFSGNDKFIRLNRLEGSNTTPTAGYVYGISDPYNPTLMGKIPKEEIPGVIVDAVNPLAVSMNGKFLISTKDTVTTLAINSDTKVYNIVENNPLTNVNPPIGTTSAQNAWHYNSDDSLAFVITPDLSNKLTVFKALINCP